MLKNKKKKRIQIEKKIGEKEKRWDYIKGGKKLCKAIAKKKSNDRISGEEVKKKRVERGVNNWWTKNRKNKKKVAIKEFSKKEIIKKSKTVGVEN